MTGHTGNEAVQLDDAQLTAVAAGDFWTDFAGAFVRGEAGGGEGPSDSGTN